LISPGAVLHVPSTIMHSNLQRLPAERARHRKRLPSQGWEDAPALARQVNGGGFTGTTFTQIIVNNPTTSTTSTTSTTPALPTDTLTSVLITTSETTLPTASVAPSPPTTVTQVITSISTPSASASAIPPSNSATAGAANSPNVAAVSTQKGLPTGAIVGITIACVMLILGAFVFFIRQRAIRSRKLRRWTGPRPTNSSFEAREAAPSTFPASGPGNMGETSPGVSFARAQAQALSARSPVPNMPQPMPSSYNNPVPPVGMVPAGAAASATVRYEFIPTLPDELSITTGENVRVVNEFDDGWALCANARGEQGMVPLECLDRGSAPNSQLQAVEQPDYRNSRRGSSLGVRY